MRELTAQDPAQDRHVAMAVFAETGAALDDVVIDDAQPAPAHPGVVEIAAEAERVVGIKPADAGATALAGGTESGSGHAAILAVSPRTPRTWAGQGSTPLPFLVFGLLAPRPSLNPHTQAQTGNQAAHHQ